MNASTTTSRPPVLSENSFDSPGSRWLAAVAGLLDEQYDLCVRLEGLSETQSSHVQAGRTEGLLSVLNERQAVLDRVVEINGTLEPFRNRRDIAMSRLQAADRESLQNRIDRIAESVERVRRRDDEDRRALESQRRGVADELANLSRLRGAAAAYAGSGATGPRFHDRQG